MHLVSLYDDSLAAPMASSPPITSNLLPSSVSNGKLTSSPTSTAAMVSRKNYCHICNKELCNKYFMKTHMLKMHGINIDENPAEAAVSSTIGGVTCDICQKELCSKYFLKVHRQNTHGIMDESNINGRDVNGSGGGGRGRRSALLDQPPNPDPFGLRSLAFDNSKLPDRNHCYVQFTFPICSSCSCSPSRIFKCTPVPRLQSPLPLKANEFSYLLMSRYLFLISPLRCSSNRKWQRISTQFNCISAGCR